MGKKIFMVTNDIDGVVNMEAINYEHKNLKRHLLIIGIIAFICVALLVAICFKLTHLRYDNLKREHVKIYGQILNYTLPDDRKEIAYHITNMPGASDFIWQTDVKVRETKMLNYRDAVNKYKELSFDPNISPKRIVWVASILKPTYDNGNTTINNAVITKMWDAHTMKLLQTKVRSLDANGVVER